MTRIFLNNSDNKKFLFLMLALSFSIRFFMGFVFLHEIPKSYGWYQIAGNIINGKGTLLQYDFSVNNNADTINLKYFAVRPPIYVLFYVMIIKWFKESLFIYLFIQSIFGTLVVLISYKIFSLFFVNSLRNLGILIISFYPYFISRTWNACEDNLYMVFVLASFWMLFSYFKNSNKKYLYLCSFLLGLSFLTRSTILIFVILLTPVLFFCVQIKRLIPVTIFYVIFILTLSPLILHNYRIYNKLTLADHGGSRFWVANNKYIYELFPKTSIDRIERMMFNDLTEGDVKTIRKMSHFEMEKFLFKKSLDFIKKNPILSLKSFLKKALAAFSLSYNPRLVSSSKYSTIKDIVYQVFYLPIFVMGIIGNILYFRKSNKEQIIFISYYLSLIVMGTILWAHTRHTIPYHISLIYGLILFIEKVRLNRKEISI